MVYPDLSNARQAVERLMADEGTISRPGGPGAFNEATGEITDPAPTLIYTGKCKVRYSGSRTDVEGGRTLVIQQFACSVPLAAGAVQPGDWLEVTESSRDPLLAGTRMRIAEVEKGTMATVRRFTAEAAVEPVAEGRP